MAKLHPTGKGWIVASLGLVALLAAGRAVATQSSPQARVRSRCVQDAAGVQLCLQALRDGGSGLRLSLTYFNAKQEAQLAEQPVLTIDGVRPALISATPFARTREPLALMAVVQLAGRQRDRAVLPFLQRGLDALITAAQRPDSRMGLLGYNVTRASYQPNVELGDPARLHSTVQELKLPIGKSLNFELYDALAEAVSRLEKEPPRGRKQVVLFTDGNEKDRVPPQVFQRLAERANRADIVISAIMQPASAEPPEFLQALVTETGGALWRNRGKSTVAASFRMAAAELAMQTIATFAPVQLANARPGSRQSHQVAVSCGPLILQTSWDIDWSGTAAASTGAVKDTRTEHRARTGLPALLLLGFGFLILSGGGVVAARRVRQGLPLLSTSLFPVPRPAAQPTIFVDGASAESAAPPLRAAQGTTGPTVCWLYEVGRQKTHRVTKYPFRIGNDLDCDLVLGGLGEPVAACRLRAKGPNIYLLPQHGHRWKDCRRLADRAEFIVGGHRLVLFETPLHD